ncbi:hypothetical protein MPC1_3880005 [Methylocella tundrae]|nr:hypothetical protein MPC1_3880005 [Methylocella tundrae]
MGNPARGFSDLVGSGCVASICLGVVDAGGWLVDLGVFPPAALPFVFLRFFTSFLATA